MESDGKQGDNLHKGGDYMTIAIVQERSEPVLKVYPNVGDALA